jgi:hypothetical protein
MLWAATLEVNENMDQDCARTHTKRKNRKTRYGMKEAGYIETFL